MISAVRITLAAAIALIGLAGATAAKPKCTGHQEGEYKLKKLPNGTTQCFLVVHYVDCEGGRRFLGSVPVDRSKCGATAR